MDAAFGLFITLFVIVAICVGLYYLANLLQETVTRQATVVSKRTAMSQGSGQSGPQTSYYCTSEFEDGQRAEYCVGGQYALISEGDRGELDTKGVLFWDFRGRSGGVKEALFEAHAGKEFETGTSNPRPQVKVRCLGCQGLNDETARFCNQCGSAM